MSTLDLNLHFEIFYIHDTCDSTFDPRDAVHSVFNQLFGKLFLKSYQVSLPKPIKFGHGKYSIPKPCGILKKLCERL
ncbi:hypothetical protein NPIL_463481 [Nephila pilipes]|uniref:Uncharacterized protein n=1 Tax=Nephila pilipes TaxID=299642 RepID=A0A8X6QL73_NEPPI|nr:hypothetical protein NPIL_463481 [Nephila pilipes]